MAASVRGDNWIYLNISLFASQSDHLAVENKQKKKDAISYQVLKGAFKVLAK
jgi:hypothetical protein